MAFLDNSGDIILDAVLTDLGRKRMAEGNFRITQFALGDDEIDYRIYNKNHPSGSAYYDLEILQTPVLEAFASSNANINYGLVSFGGNLNLLYMPNIKIWGNPKTVSVTGKQILRASGSVYYMSANTDTSTALVSAFDTDYGTGNGALYYSSDDNANVILLETGIDSPGGFPPRTADLTNENNLIIGKGLADGNFDVHVDTNILTTVVGISSIVWDVPTTGEGIQTIINGLTPINANVSSDLGMANYAKATISGHRTKVRATSGTTADTYSAINGPSGQMVAVTFEPNTNLKQSSADYAKYGKTGQDLFGDGNTYDYVDTTVYVVGKSSGVTAHVPVRVVRKVV